MAGLLTLMAVRAQDDGYKLRHDTLRIYASWQSLMQDEPLTLLVNPSLTSEEKTNRLEISCPGGKSKESVNMDIRQSAAVVLDADGETYCFVNCAWLNRMMDDGAVRLGRQGFLPIFFNEKMACVVLTERYVRTRWERDGQFEITRLYHLDFENKCVHEINSKYLLELLNPYPDLRLRYEGCRNKSSEEMISDFLEKYMKRIEEEEDVPYIDDFLEEK